MTDNAGIFLNILPGRLKLYSKEALSRLSVAELQEMAMEQIQTRDQPSYRIEERNDCIRVSFLPGTLIDFDILMEVIDIDIEHIKQRGKNDLWVMQGCTFDKDLNSQSLRDVVLSIKARGLRQDGKGRTAILANTDFIYGLARTFQSLAEVKDIGYQIEVFQDESLALSWLTASI